MSLFSRKSTEPSATRSKAPVIVIGNEKGGCGKSTTAMHLIVGLMDKGYRVASFDLDIRQSSLSRYVANRKAYVDAIKHKISMPAHFTGTEVAGNDDSKGETSRAAERLQFLIDGATINHDVVVIDTPGSDSPLSRMAHGYASLLVTPVNDSFVDLDVLGHIDVRRKQVLGPSHYSEMVMEKRLDREQDNAGQLDWFVIRNRISTLNSHNTRDVDWALTELATAMKFNVLPGFSERVIFRELFLVGLTILDLKEASGGKPLSTSHLAAREEVRGLVSAIMERVALPTSG